MLLLHLFYGFFSIGGGKGSGAGALQLKAQHHGVDGIIFHDEQLFMFQPLLQLLLLRMRTSLLNRREEAKVDVETESSALARLTFYADMAIVQFHQAFGNGQS